MPLFGHLLSSNTGLIKIIQRQHFSAQSPGLRQQVRQASRQGRLATALTTGYTNGFKALLLNLSDQPEQQIWVFFIFNAIGKQSFFDPGI